MYMWIWELDFLCNVASQAQEERKKNNIIYSMVNTDSSLVLTKPLPYLCLLTPTTCDNNHWIEDELRELVELLGLDEWTEWSSKS